MTRRWPGEGGQASVDHTRLPAAFGWLSGAEAVLKVVLNVMAIPKSTARPGRHEQELVTRLALASRLSCVVRTITKWEREGLPVATRGKGGQPSLYDLAEVRAWLAERQKRTRHDSAALMSARCRKERAQAAESEQRVALRAGRLIPVEEVERVWSAEVAAVRARLLVIPTTLADKLHLVGTLEGAPGIERELQAAVYEVLTELAAGETPTKKKRGEHKIRRRRRVPPPKGMST